VTIESLPVSGDIDGVATADEGLAAGHNGDR
jgi:hypothetical protein